jgi:hypothetical protein
MWEHLTVTQYDCTTIHLEAHSYIFVGSGSMIFNKKNQAFAVMSKEVEKFFKKIGSNIRNTTKE